MGKTEVAAAQIINPVLAELGYELVDINYVKEGGEWYLRVFIDRPEEGISLTDCQLVSESIEPLLDEYDPIPHGYMLEVSSPGLDRPLKKQADYVRFIGERVRLSTYGLVNGQRKFKGFIMAAGSDSVTLNVEGTQIVLPLEQIVSARLLPEF